MSRPVSRSDRVRDILALGILGGGALVYAIAYSGMHTLAAKPIVVVPGHPAMQRFTHYWQLSQVGLILLAIGVLAVAWSFLSYRAPSGERA